MAKNYTFAEAVKIIHAGTNMEAIADIGRRYPILLHKVTKVATQAGADFVDLMGYMPDYLTANKVNTALKNIADADTEADNTDTDADENEAEATEATEVEAVDAGATDYESMSAKQMWELLGKAGKRKLAKSTKKADLIEACKQAFGNGAAAEDEADAETEEAETEANPYDGKSAMELFKECKKRGIKAPAKKPAKFYADMLVKDDAAKNEADNSADEADDWEDDDEAKEEPKPPKKSAKKPAKKEEATDDDDDDWDI